MARSDLSATIAAAEAFTAAMKSFGGPREKPSVAERYELLREQYAGDKIDLEDFTAAVVALLMEGL